MSDGLRFHRLDADTAQALLGATVFDAAVDPANLAAFVADPGHELVFVTAGQTVVGFASGAVLLHPDKAPSFYINEVGVAPDWQRQGLGVALCTRLMELARGRGCKGIWLATETDNAAARALYRALDARETGGVVVYDWDGAMGPDPSG